MARQSGKIAYDFRDDYPPDERKQWPTRKIPGPERSKTGDEQY
jgi:hypothetical protein